MLPAPRTPTPPIPTDLMACLQRMVSRPGGTIIPATGNDAIYPDHLPIGSSTLAMARVRLDRLHQQVQGK